MDDVLRAARAHLHPDDLQTVVVGDANVIRESLAQLELGDLQIPRILEKWRRTRRSPAA